MKKTEAQKKLLLSIKEVAAGMTEGRTGWHGHQRVESAIMMYLCDFTKRRDWMGLLEDDLEDYLSPPKE